MNTEIKNSSFAEILHALQSVENILIASHIRPDGDALGSTIACSLWLQSLGKRVTTWNQDGLPHRYSYLPAHSLVTAPPLSGNKQSFQVTVVLDTSTRSRLGTILDAIDSPGVIINIDHHISNHRYGNLNFIDPSAPATGQILFDLLRHAKAHFTPDIASNIYAAISTDTGSFQYRGTSPHTFEIAADLLRLGVDVAELSQAIYDNQSRRRFQLLRHALNRVEFSCGDTIAHFSLLIADLQQLQALPEDGEGIIDHMRSIEGVLVAVFFEELPNGELRISTRSKDPRIDVCKICGQFGGGGHPAAAGVRIQGHLHIVRQQFLDIVCHEIQNLS